MSMLSSRTYVCTNVNKMKIEYIFIFILFMLQKTVFAGKFYYVSKFSHAIYVYCKL